MCMTLIELASTQEQLTRISFNTRQLTRTINTNININFLDSRLMSARKAVAEIDLDDLRVQVEGLDLEKNKLNSGAYGVVYEVTVDGKKCVAKKLHGIWIYIATCYRFIRDLDYDYIYRSFSQECRILSQLKHPNVVKFVGVHYYDFDKKNISLIMERIHYNLANFVKRYPDTPLCDRLHILYDVSKGLDYLHSQSPPLIHRDLGAHIILLTKDLTAKIGDFGISRYVCPERNIIITSSGPFSYMPPEYRVSNPTYTTKLDIFSFGILIIHTITGNKPGMSDIPPDPDKASKHCLYPLIVHCLKDNPDQRPTAGEVRNGVKKLCINHPKLVSYFT